MLPRRWFHLPDLELGGILMSVVNEMLLQSHDGVIRLFPALPQEWRDAAFQLRAVGAFLVTAEIRAGEIQPFLIESLAGAECRVESPWAGQDTAVRNLSSGALLPVRGAAIRFDTQPGARYLVFRAGQAEKPPQPLPPRHGPNQTPKKWHGCWLGIPRYF